MSKRKFSEITDEIENLPIHEFTDKDILQDNIRSCLTRLKNNQNITRSCHKLLYLSGLKTPEKQYRFNYSLANYGNLQTALGQVVTILYLLYKNPDDCAIFNKSPNSYHNFLDLYKKGGFDDNIIIHYVTYIDQKDRLTSSYVDIKFPNYFSKQVKKCQNKKFTVCFLAYESIEFEEFYELLNVLDFYLKHKQIKKNTDIDVNVNDFDKKTIHEIIHRPNFFKYVKSNFPQFLSYHQNCIIIDNINNTIERFEPHGSSSNYEMKIIDTSLKKELYKQIGKNFTYISPIDFCPRNGFQVLEQDEQLNTQLDFQGYCYMWTIFYMEMRMSRPNIPRNELIQKTLKYFEQNQIKLKNYIYDYIFYHSYIINVIENLIKQYINSKLPNIFISFVILQKIKELSKIYTESIFITDVKIDDIKNKTHLSKIKDYLTNNINKILLTPELKNKNISREYLLSDEIFKPPPIKKRKKLKGGKKSKKSNKLKKRNKYSGKKNQK